MTDDSVLIARFLAALPPELNIAGGPSPDLGAELRGLLQRAHDAWPQFSTQDEEFVGFLAGQSALAGSPGPPLDSLAVEDLYLSYACLRQEPEALNALERVLTPVAGYVLNRLHVPEHRREEILQSTREALLVGTGGRPPVLGQYRGTGRLASWLRVVLLRRAIRFEESEKRLMPLSEAAASILDVESSDPELEHLRTHYLPRFKEALAQALDGLEARDRNTLRYYLVEHLTIGQIGAVYGVDRSTVTRWLRRIRELLFDNTRRHLRQSLKIDNAELESIVRLLRTRLDFTFSRVLGRATRGG